MRCGVSPTVPVGVGHRRYWCATANNPITIGMLRCIVCDRQRSTGRLALMQCGIGKSG